MTQPPEEQTPGDQSPWAAPGSTGQHSPGVGQPPPAPVNPYGGPAPYPPPYAQPSAYGGPPVAYQPPPAAPPGPPKALSITAFVLGLVGCVPVLAIAAVVVGVIALVKRQALKGLAIAGTVLGTLWLVLTVWFFASGAAQDFSEGLSSAVDDAFSYEDYPPRAVAASELDLRVGDCFHDPDGMDWEYAGRDIIVVDCEQRHGYEVFDSSELEGTAWPGETGIIDAADMACYAAFEEFVDYSYYRSELYYSWFAPTEASWQEGDRLLLCVVSDPARSTGSLEGARR